MNNSKTATQKPVSYTHLDVYKRQEVKEVKRARLTEYAAAKLSAEYHAKQNGEHGVWPVSYTHLVISVDGGMHM